MYDKPKKKDGEGGGFSNLLKTFVPQKGDVPFELARKSVFCGSLLICLVALIAIIIAAAASGNKEEEIITVSAWSGFIDGSVSIAPLPELPVQQILERVRLDDPDMAAAYEINNDVVGWIHIPGTVLDNPVLQYPHLRYEEFGVEKFGNEYYLHRDINHNWFYDGVIFADVNAPVLGERRPGNIILYGHNLLNRTMFRQAALYWPYFGGRSNIDFYRENPVVHFDTLYERGVYKVFAVGLFHTEDPDNIRRGIAHDVYNYHRIRNFPDRDAFYDFIVNILDRSGFYNPDVDLMYGDEIITLSTCYYPLGEHIDTRIAVFARRVRDGESPVVDIDAAWLNPNPHYFDHYYNVRGGSWGGRNWDTSKVAGLDEWLTARGE